MQKYIHIHTYEHTHNRHTTCVHTHRYTHTDIHIQIYTTHINAFTHAHSSWKRLELDRDKLETKVGSQKEKEITEKERT